MKYLNSFLLLVILAVGASMIVPQYSFAANANDFKPGRIINDSVFFDKDSMTVSQIQQFLDSKMPSCDTNHAESSHWKDFGPPYICLKDYREDPTVEIKDCTDEEIQNHFGFGSNDSRYEAAKNYCWWKRGRTNLVGKTAGSSSKSAAQIIWDAAQEHRINPQVLLVTLQKEQSLLTDDYPWVGQYQKAMGYACPDTADCDPQFRGFYNQVDNAAWQFRRYVTYPEQYKHAVGDNFVRYHPNSSCGGSMVTIQTAGTAALYNYTPYQPNKDSLDAYPGTGNSCSSYGNRNFWFRFHDWFGNPAAKASYNWSVQAQALYTDGGMTDKLPYNAILEPGKKYYIRIKAKNTGNQIWYKSILRLGTFNPRDRISTFRGDAWPSGSRVASMTEEQVSPGESATFVSDFIAPEKTGSYKEYFNLVAEGIAWLNDIGLYIPVNVEPSREFSVYHSDAKVHSLNNQKISMYADTKLYVTVKVRNTGDETWPAGMTRIGTTQPMDRSSVFRDASWPTQNRAAKLENDLKPGETGTFEFTMTAPKEPGNFEESFGIVIEGQKWIETDTATLNIPTKEKPDDRIFTGDRLNQKDKIVSKNGDYRLVMQSDGNLVIYTFNNKALWSSKTSRTSGSRIILQDDGNLVLYDSDNRALWHTRTMGKDSDRLVMQNDGNLVLRNATGKALWHTATFR